MNSITQDARYRYSLMKYVEKWRSRGKQEVQQELTVHLFLEETVRRKRGIASVQIKTAAQPPGAHSAGLTLIRDMRRRNPKLGIVKLWARMRAQGYTRCVESLWRVMRREGLIADQSTSIRIFIVVSLLFSIYLYASK